MYYEVIANTHSRIFYDYDNHNHRIMTTVACDDRWPKLFSAPKYPKYSTAHSTKNLHKKTDRISIPGSNKLNHDIHSWLGMFSVHMQYSAPQLTSITYDGVFPQPSTMLPSTATIGYIISFLKFD